VQSSKDSSFEMLLENEKKNSKCAVHKRKDSSFYLFILITLILVE